MSLGVDSLGVIPLGAEAATGGVAPTYTLTASAGAFTLAGNATGLTASRALVAAKGTFTLTGNAAGLAYNRVLTAAKGTFNLTGNAVTLTYTPAGATYTLAAETGSFTLAGNASSLTANRVLSAESGQFTLTGSNATFIYPYNPISTSSGGRGGGGVGWSKAEWKKRKQLDEAIEASLKEQLTPEDKVEIAQEIAGPRATKAQIAEIVKQLTPAPRPLMMPAPRPVVEDDDDEVAVRLLLEEDHADLHLFLRKVRETLRDV